MSEAGLQNSSGDLGWGFFDNCLLNHFSGNPVAEKTSFQFPYLNLNQGKGRFSVEEERI